MKESDTDRPLCIIPARGGSKRIPRKNIRPLHGCPLLGWTISLAKGCGVFGEVIVSTDDEEIASVAKRFGASVPFRRSAENSGDTVSTTAVIFEVLESCRNATGLRPAVACCLYPGAVLVSADSLRKGYELLAADERFDSCISVQRFRHPIERALKTSGGILLPLNEEAMAMRTQDLEPKFHDAGQFYWFKTRFLRDNQRLLGKRCAPVVLDANEAVDLDTLEDWRLLEILSAAMPVPAEP